MNKITIIDVREVEADSPEEAEQKAWPTFDKIEYAACDEIVAKEIEE